MTISERAKPADQIELLRHAKRDSDARQAELDKLLREFGLTFARWQVLDASGSSREPASAASIARALGHSRQAVNRIVSHLADAGLVRLQPNPLDQRAQLVQLPEQGHKVLAEATQRLEAFARDRSGAESDADLPPQAGLENLAGRATAARPRVKRPRRARAFELVQQQILDQIRNGALSPGCQLPPERDLAKRLGFGRSAVREALRSLEAAGILKFESGAKGGAFVRESGSDGIATSIRAMLILGKLPLTDLLEVRASLLGQCARLGTSRATAQDFEQLDANIDDMERTIAAHTDQLRSIPPAVQFYRLAARASHNPLMVLLVDAIADLVAEMLSSMGNWPRSDSITARREMVKAMREGRADDAERVIRVHSHETNRLLIKYESHWAARRQD